MAQTISERYTEKANRFLENLNRNLTKAFTPQPEWTRFNSQTQQEEMSKQMNRAIETGKQEIQGIIIEISQEMENVNKAISAKKHPLQSSFLPDYQRRGEFYDSKAERVLMSIEFKDFVKEYRRAIEENLIDYASSLIEWSERIYSHQEYLQLLDIRREHDLRINIEQEKRDYNELAMIIKKLEPRKKLLWAGIAKDFSQATNAEEHANMLILAGLAT